MAKQTDQRIIYAFNRYKEHEYDLQIGRITMQEFNEKVDAIDAEMAETFGSTESFYDYLNISKYIAHE